MGQPPNLTKIYNPEEICADIFLIYIYIYICHSARVVFNWQHLGYLLCLFVCLSVCHHKWNSFLKGNPFIFICDSRYSFLILYYEINLVSFWVLASNPEDSATRVLPFPPPPFFPSAIPLKRGIYGGNYDWG